MAVEQMDAEAVRSGQIPNHKPDLLRRPLFVGWCVVPYGNGKRSVGAPRREGGRRVDRYSFRAQAVQQLESVVRGFGNVTSSDQTVSTVERLLDNALLLKHV